MIVQRINYIYCLNQSIKFSIYDVVKLSYIDLVNAPGLRGLFDLNLQDIAFNPFNENLEFIE